MTSQVISENLLTNQTSNGNGTAITYNGTRERLDLHFQGTFNGVVIKRNARNNNNIEKDNPLIV